MILSPRGGRTSREGDLGAVGGSIPMNPDANGTFIFQAYPGVYRLFLFFSRLHRPTTWTRYGWATRT
jgi:hypothetical protein